MDKSHHSARDAIKHDLKSEDSPGGPKAGAVLRPCPTIWASGVSPATDGFASPVVRGAEPHPGTRSIPLGTSAALQSFYAATLRTA